MIQQTIENLRARMASVADSKGVEAMPPQTNVGATRAIGNGARPSAWRRFVESLRFRPQADSVSADLAVRVTRLENERAIVETLNLYAQSIDYGVYDEWVDCFVADGVLDIRPQFRNTQDGAPFSSRP
jgi:hypothetical protein